MSTSSPRIHSFKDNAMATVFELRICHADGHYARQAAQAAFATVHRIEELLSRFLETSEVSRIRMLRPGDSLRLHVHTAACLETALRIMEFTGGAFDPTLGAHMDALTSAAADPMLSPTAQAQPRPRAVLALDPDTLTLFCDGEPNSAPVHLDLGAIGKGFALDVIAEELREWDVTSALLMAGGGSSILAMDPPVPEVLESSGGDRDGNSAGSEEGWCVSLSSKQLLFIENAAISTSGTAVKGAHILDPRTGRPPVAAPVRTWALAPAAAESDALSTAWMLLTQEEIHEICGAISGVVAALEIDDTPGAAHPLIFIDSEGIHNAAPDDLHVREISC